MTEGAERIRTLLLRADNVLKHAGSDETGLTDGRRQRARDALVQARGLAAEPGVDARIGGLVERRLAALDGLEGDGGSAG